MPGAKKKAPVDTVRLKRDLAKDSKINEKANRTLDSLAIEREARNNKRSKEDQRDYITGRKADSTANVSMKRALARSDSLKKARKG